MNKKTNKFAFLGLALLPFLVLGLDFVILLIESLFYGTMHVSTFGAKGIIIHWIYTIIVWGVSVFALIILSKKAGYNVFENKNNPKLINWIIVGVLVIITAIVSYINWDMQFKPLVEYNSFINKYNDNGIIMFITQYMYYFIESMLFLAIIVFSQEFGERMFKNKIIPWGGIMCGLTWGLMHLISKENITIGFLLLLVSVFYGVVYLQLKKNIKYAYIIITFMFLI
jgi:hypothetical protein